jgi:hypothetical protein
MSATPDVHATCIREDPEMDTTPFTAEYCKPVDAVVAALPTIDLSSHGGLDEICDLALDLMLFIRDQPTPHLRYAAMEGVIYHLVKALAPDPIEEDQA